MLLNYFKIAFRNLVKYKGFTLINLFGLAIGLTAGILIMVYVLDELSFDNFHEKSARIYRVNTTFQTDGSLGGSNETNGWPIGKVLEKDFPEVEAVLYTRNAFFLTINHEDKRMHEKMHFATPEFFQMFSFPLIKGNSQKALTEPYSVVISEDMEKKYFPGGDALNKTLVMVDTLHMVVTGVMKKIPSNSHIQADMIVSFSTYTALETSFSYDDGWGNINMRNYVLLKEGTDFENFSAKAKNIYMDRAGQMMKEWGVSAYVSFEPIERIYLYSKSGNGMGPLGSIDRVYLMAGIAAFVILLACINFINLATARSVHRAKEVGLRKVVGSSRNGLIAQFLSESFVLTLLSLIVSIGIVLILMPYFNQLIGKNYELISLVNLSILASIAMLVLLVALLAGYYPAWIISALKPTEVLKGKMQTSSRGIQLRRTLVVFQFVISAGLVSGTWIVIDQLTFMQKQNLGFDKDQVIVLNGARIRSFSESTKETFKDQLAALAMVDKVTYANALPGSSGWQGQVAYPEGKSGEDAVSVEYMSVDENYLELLGLELIAGRGFDKQREADLKEGLIVNATAVTAFGWTSPEEAIGKKITSPSGTPAGEVIGVIKDYHQEGLQQKIGPVAMAYAPQFSYLYAIKYKAANTQDVISSLQNLWASTFAGYDFDYFFLDQNFEAQYQAEKRLANVLSLFAIVTMVIAAIGLLGLVSFMVVARTKEIGVRKILGADVFSITTLLTKEFVMLIVIANLIAIPLVWYFADQWLQVFAFRTTVNPLLFLGTMVIALTATLLIVGAQTIRAANANPVNSLRSE
ncbi:MAG: ABC transporter permease [Cyclobacteriaceae bacterium]|nr:ABC transporter permease [Cyclobacteriaceae bacterium]